MGQRLRPFDENEPKSSTFLSQCLYRNIYGMTTNFQNQGTPRLDLPAIFRQLASSKKWSVIQYLLSARFATATVIQQRCQIRQPTCSKILNSLAKAELISRVKLRSVIIYEINGTIWGEIKEQLPQLAK